MTSGDIARPDNVTNGIPRYAALAWRISCSGTVRFFSVTTLLWRYPESGTLCVFVPPPPLTGAKMKAEYQEYLGQAYIYIIAWERTIMQET